MVAHGVSLRAVQIIGGWTSLRMVERYSHLDDAELQRAVRLTHNHTEAATAGGNKGTQRPEPPIKNPPTRKTGNRNAYGSYETGVPNGIRTRVLALKGPRPGPLDDGDSVERTSDSTTT
jgi:hypothetical protein